MAKHDSQAKVVQGIYSWHSENQLWVNRRYQRKLVWTIEEKQKLIESLLREYPIPAVLLAERDGNEYEVIDGLQRLHTILSFIEGSFPTSDDRYFDISHFTAAQIRADEGLIDGPPQGANLLTAKEVRGFLDYEVPVSIMRGATAQEIEDVFSRINTYGHRLSDQERRQAGVGNDFASLVRVIASEVRRDASADELLMQDMPSISIDLPMTNHGYQVKASEVFWCRHGILRSTELRDSNDEQCVADIVAIIAGGQVIPRSKDALDQVYLDGTAENGTIAAGLDAYGGDRLKSEFYFIVDEVEKIVGASGEKSLRSLLFATRTNNSFTALFTVVFIALHEMLIKESKAISDYGEAARALKNLNRRIDTNRGSTTPEQRRANIDVVHGLLGRCAVPADHSQIYGEHSTTDIEVAINRSSIETPHFELKQGMRRLDDAKSEDPGMVDKILRTCVAMANNGKDRSGTLLIGVADDDSDARRVEDLYGITARRVGNRWVVGVKREADHEGITVEEYVGRIKTAVRESSMSEPLRSAVLAGLDYNDYFGLGVVAISIPPMAAPSDLDGHVYVRAGDENNEVHGAEVFSVVARF